MSEFDALLLASGGMDSTVLAYDLLKMGKRVILLFLDYRQHCVKKEYETLQIVAPKQFLDNIRVIKIGDVYKESKSRMICEANLWIDTVVAQDLYLPYRNLLFLSTASAYAQSKGMQTIKLEDLINWKNKRKLQTITQLSWLLQEFDVQTESQLKLWLENDHNLDALLQVNGIGPKTIDYLKMLSGCQSIAIDRHLFKYLRLAGIAVSTYSEARTIYNSAADSLGITPYEFDKSIWNTMSKGLA